MAETSTRAAEIVRRQFIEAYGLGKNPSGWSSRPAVALAVGFLFGRQPRACSDVQFRPLAQSLRVLRATCRGILVLPPVLAPTHQRFRTSSSAPRPFAGISGSTSSSSRCILSRKLCPILCVTSRVHSTRREESGTLVHRVVK